MFLTTAATASLYKVGGLGFCAQANVPTQFAEKVEQYTGFAVGACTDYGYSTEVGSNNLAIPDVGPVEVELWRKEAYKGPISDLSGGSDITLHGIEGPMCAEI